MSSSVKKKSCDNCKRRKVRCVGPSSNNESCGTCLAAKLTCTYSGNYKNRVISKDYIERLESRLAELEHLLKQAQKSDSLKLSSVDSHNEHPCAPGTSNNEATNGGGELELSDDEFDNSVIEQGVSSLDLNPRFHGRSSSSKLISDIFERKRQAIQNTSSPLNQHASTPDLFKRPEYWSPYPWESESQPVLDLFSFPEKHLFTSLIALYFEHVNYLYGLLHRPTFETLVAQGVHHYDPQFSNVVYLVIANGARFSNDSRVVLEGTDSWLSAGWKWFKQANVFNKSTLSATNLYNLQAIVLYTVFVQKSPLQEEGYSLICTGLGLAIGAGAHRKKFYSSNMSITDEMWKRACWCLYLLNRQLCLSLGRPCSYADEEFDLDLPIDCDDEYLNPENGFQQPPDKPSKLAFAQKFIEATVVLSHVLRTVYSNHKAKTTLGYTGQGWEERAVAELNSKLNDWHSRIPTHLRFSTDIEDPLFFVQAAIIGSVYHDLRILVHHPFVAPGGKPCSITRSSLAACDNAARASSGIAFIVSRKAPMVLAPVLMHTAFVSAIVLCFKMFTCRRARTVIDEKPIMDSIFGCMALLENAETRSWTAGQQRDILYNLAQLGDLTLPSTASTPSPPPFNMSYPSTASSVDEQGLFGVYTPHRPVDQQQPTVPEVHPFDADQQIFNMWNDVPMAISTEQMNPMDSWTSYLATLDWISTNGNTV